MDTSVLDASITSSKRKRNEEEVAELEETIFIVLSVVTMLWSVVAWYHEKYFVKEPARNWELERRSFLNRLYRGTENDCIEQLRVSKGAFFKLCRILKEKGQLVRTKNVPTTEVVAMFLHILAHNLKYRVVHFSYYRSKETISRQFNNVLRAVMKVNKEYLKFHDYNLEGSEAYKWRWFEVCLSYEANEEEEDCNMNIGLEEQSSGTKKRGQVNRAYKSRDKEGIITSMREVAESSKEFVQVTKKKMEGNAQEVVEEVLNELRMIFDLENSQRYKAIAWLTENPNKLAILKALPLGEKKDFILAFMS